MTGVVVAFTVMLIGMTWGMFGAAWPVTTIDPVDDVGEDSPAGSTETVSVAGVLPERGFTENQFPPIVETLNDMGAVPFTAMVCGADATPPIVKLKANDAGATDSMGAAVTKRLTGRVIGLLEAPCDVIVTDPVYVPADRPAGFTDTLRVAGVEPENGLTDNQFPPAAATVNNTDAVLPNEMLWAPSVAPPVW
jgi:hypothetical protein